MLSAQNLASCDDASFMPLLISSKKYRSSWLGGDTHLLQI